MTSPRNPPGALSDSQMSAHSRSNNLFQCGTCSQSYTRVDHLARHIRSHTKEKPYHCTVCDKRFGRIDLLNRHSALHDPRRESTSTKRRRTTGNGSVRASQACEACAENHLRCNEEKPCRRCQRRGVSCSLAPGSVIGISSTPRTVISGSLEADTAGLRDQGASSQPAHPPQPPSIGGPYQALTSADRLGSPNLDQQTPLPGVVTSAGEGQTEGIGVISELYPTLLPQCDELSPGFPNVTSQGLIAFGLETDLDLSMVDLSFLESYNARIPFEYEAAYTTASPAPSVHAVEDDGAQMDHDTREDRSVQRLRWRFVPVPQDHGYAEHGNLLLTSQKEADTSLQSLCGMGTGPVAEDSLDLASRDKILSIMLNQMPKPLSHSVSSFPSPELLDHLIRYYLTAPFSGASRWIHRGTFIPKQSRPELLLAMAAAGAVATPDSALQKLGFAMQEVVRHQLSIVFEDDNTLIRDLEMHQAFLLHLEICLWSGNSRKIEICESFRQPLITMLRRGGRFHKTGYPVVTVHPTDTGQILEDKWRAWARQESHKRLVYHMWRHDTQSSMVLLASPLMSYAEMSIPLPSSPALWNANDAEQWKKLYCAQQAGLSYPSPLPTLTECVLNMDLLETRRAMVDMSTSCTAVLCALWGMIWEYRQMNLLISGSGSGTILAPSRSWHSGLLMASRYQQLTELLDYFGIVYRSEGESSLQWHSTMMHMHMSLEEIQTLVAAMKRQATVNRIPSSVQIWAQSKEGRQAVWHAGQVVRELKALPPHFLQEFAAVALFHSALALWAYGTAVGTLLDVDTSPLPIWLDGTETDDVQRFISLGRGRPIIQGVPSDVGAVGLDDPTGVLTLAIQLIRQNHNSPKGHEPPLVINLVHLMEKLREMNS